MVLAYRPLAVGVVMMYSGCHVDVHKCIAVIDFFTSLCTNAGSYSDMACIYDFTCVYVASIQTSLKLLLAFVHSVVKKRFLSIIAIHLCTPTWRPRHGHIQKVNGNIRSRNWSIRVIDAFHANIMNNKHLHPSILLVGKPRFTSILPTCRQAMIQMY